MVKLHNSHPNKSKIYSSIYDIKYFAKIDSFYTKVRIYTHSLSEMVESKFRCTNAEFVLRKSFRYRWLFTPSKRMVNWINSPALFLACSCNATADVAILTCLAFSSSSSDELSSVILSSYAFWIKTGFKSLIYRTFGLKQTKYQGLQKDPTYL